MGVNDFYAGVGNIETAATQVHPLQYTLTNTRAFARSTRSSAWGGAGNIQSVDCTFEILFSGGYETTRSSDGATVLATGVDHRRHFFNSGGEIRISGVNASAATLKGSDWATMLQNMGTVVLGKNSTTVTGTGRPANGSTDVDRDGNIDPAIGNFQLTTSYQLIFQRNGGGESANYQENIINIWARINASGNLINIFVQLNDNDVGDVAPNSDPKSPPSPPGPGQDENVDGSLTIGLDLKRATGTVVVQTPLAGVADELFT
jgi:hypothetical protein